MNLKNCYKILEIHEDASLPEIRQAYRDLIGIWHPDRYVNNPRLYEKATEKLKLLNLAYNELSKQLSAGVTKSEVKSSYTGNSTHIIIVKCPTCQTKNRLKAGQVTRHPRCGSCHTLLFHKTKPHENARESTGKSDAKKGRASDETMKNKAWAKATPDQPPHFEHNYPKEKRRFWNKWILLATASCLILVLANTTELHQQLTKLFKQIPGGRYLPYLKDSPSKPKLNNPMSSENTTILNIQGMLHKTGYLMDSPDGIWGEQTQNAVKQFRDDHYLNFLTNDIPAIDSELRRQESIREAHPDWNTIAPSEFFSIWIEEQVMTSPKVIKDVLATGKVDQVVSLIKWFKFDRLQPDPISMPRNGILKKGYHKGIAPLTIRTRNDGRHYYLKLINATNGMDMLIAFIRGGTSLVEHVPVGQYSLKYAVGDNWYGPDWLFGPGTVFREMDQVFDFKIQDDQIAGYRLDLYLQPLGLGGGKKEYTFDF